eukprot:scaffold78136_cov53-Attheya_sp.AAC.4
MLGVQSSHFLMAIPLCIFCSLLLKSPLEVDAFMTPSNSLLIRRSSGCSFKHLETNDRKTFINLASSTKREEEDGSGPTLSQSLLTSATAALLMTSVLLSTPVNAVAASFDPSLFNGDYEDPFHPLCERHIDVSADKKSFHYSGTGVGPKSETSVLRGCSAEEQEKYGSRKGAFDGDIEDGNKISAGDGIHEGVWEPAGTILDDKLTGIDRDGIRWNDGNKWVKTSPASNGMDNMGENAGKAFFLAYVGFSLLAGFKELAKRFQKWNENRT